LYPYQKLQNKPYPIFSGKEKYNSYLDYIANKLQFPTEALKLNLKGEVVVTFVIEPSGFISNLEVLKKMPAGCTEEAVRLIEELHWHPAIKNEQAVRTIMITSVGFGVSSSTFHGAFNQGLNGR
jgi:outer membrane biosynthesis protein TonB